MKNSVLITLVAIFNCMALPTLVQFNGGWGFVDSLLISSLLSYALVKAYGTNEVIKGFTEVWYKAASLVSFVLSIIIYINQ